MKFALRLVDEQSVRVRSSWRWSVCGLTDGGLRRVRRVGVGVACHRFVENRVLELELE